MRVIKPILTRKKYEDAIQKRIYAYLYEQIFAPIYQILLRHPTKENAPTTMLVNYLRIGRLVFEGGKYFRGNLNATISKSLRELGATWNKTQKAYQIEYSALPTEVKVAIVEGTEKLKAQADQVSNFLNAIEGRDLPSLGIELEFRKTIEDLDKQFTQTTSKVLPQHFEVAMSPYYKNRMEEEYVEQLDLAIKDLHEKTVVRLRQQVLDNTLVGFRAENLITGIQQENRKTYNHAKFIAKQETSLLTSAYREARYTDNGINFYMWSTSHDRRVRPMHKALQGQYFRFDNPPVTDALGHKNNPGEDFGCRCVSIPILDENLERRLEEKRSIINV